MDDLDATLSKQTQRKDVILVGYLSSPREEEEEEGSERTKRITLHTSWNEDPSASRKPQEKYHTQLMPQGPFHTTPRDNINSIIIYMQAKMIYNLKWQDRRINKETKNNILNFYIMLNCQKKFATSLQ
ncbi:hypothetical protein ACJX0J_019318, partial [Zea mays]